MIRLCVSGLVAAAISGCGVDPPLSPPNDGANLEVPQAVKVSSPAFLFSSPSADGILQLNCSFSSTLGLRVLSTSRSTSSVTRSISTRVVSASYDFRLGLLHLTLIHRLGHELAVSQVVAAEAKSQDLLARTERTRDVAPLGEASTLVELLEFSEPEPCVPLVSLEALLGAIECGVKVEEHLSRIVLTIEGSSGLVSYSMELATLKPAVVSWNEAEYDVMQYTWSGEGVTCHVWRSPSIGVLRATLGSILVERNGNPN